jgi:hypothetical protein
MGSSSHTTASSRSGTIRRPPLPEIESENHRRPKYLAAELVSVLRVGPTTAWNLGVHPRCPCPSRRRRVKFGCDTPTNYIVQLALT